MISLDDHQRNEQVGKVPKSNEFDGSKGHRDGGKSGMPIGLKSNPIRPLANLARGWWVRRSLFEQFAITSSVVLTMSVVAVGGWVGARIADGVLRGTSGAA